MPIRNNSSSHFKGRSWWLAATSKVRNSSGGWAACLASSGRPGRSLPYRLTRAGEQASANAGAQALFTDTWWMRFLHLSFTLRREREWTRYGHMIEFIAPLKPALLLQLISFIIARACMKSPWPRWESSSHAKLIFLATLVAAIEWKSCALSNSSLTVRRIPENNKVNLTDLR